MDIDDIRNEINELQVTNKKNLKRLHLIRDQLAFVEKIEEFSYYRSFNFHIIGYKNQKFKEMSSPVLKSKAITEAYQQLVLFLKEHRMTDDNRLIMSDSDSHIEVESDMPLLLNESLLSKEQRCQILKNLQHTVETETGIMLLPIQFTEISDIGGCSDSISEEMFHRHQFLKLLGLRENTSYKLDLCSATELNTSL